MTLEPTSTSRPEDDPVIERAGHPAREWPGWSASFLSAVRTGDDAAIDAMVERVSSMHRYLAPVALIAGAITLLFEGVRLLVSNWRLTLVQVLPAMWIWAVMLDLKAHILHGRAFHALHGPVLIPMALGVVVLTAASYFLNAVFAFAISPPGRPDIGFGYLEARRHARVVIAWGAAVGVVLAFGTLVTVRWGSPWFAVTVGSTAAFMMVTYVAIPARLLGVRPKPSRRDKLASTAVGGAIGAAVCAPGYLLGRLGIVLLGSEFVLGAVLLSIGLIFQAGTTGAVKSVKLSLKLRAGSAADRAPVGQAEAGG